MKSNVLPVLLISFLLTVPMAHAAEQLSFEPVLLSQTGAAQSETFRAVVTGDGKLIVKSGVVFTEGIEAAGTELPYLLSAPQSITYPRWALHQGWQGELTIAVEILPNGVVGRSSIVNSSGYSVLDHAATEAMQSWHFQPAMIDGKPVLSCIQIPVRFQIDSKN